jgi:hypothetical protein
MIASAPWDGRRDHTSVVDAAGAIYVLGGYNGGTGTTFKDVWVSTDGGARPDSHRVGRGYSGGSRRYCKGSTGVLQEYYKGY